MQTSTFSSTDEEYKITKKSKIMPTSAEFTYNPEVSSSLMTISAALLADEYKVVDLVAKVMTNTDQTQLVFKQGQQLK